MTRTADPEEIARFDAMADEWWDETGPAAPLHALNPARISAIRDAAVAHFGREPEALAPLAGLTALDIGCGGGLAVEPLARMGARVTASMLPNARSTRRAATPARPDSTSTIAGARSRSSTGRRSTSFWRWK